MASLSDVTAVMGEYMLKGWVLTDKQCATSGCAVPLMRSPRGQTPEVWFCAKCNGAPGAPTNPVSQASSPSTSSTVKSNGFPGSRSSTPLTEVENDEDNDEEFVLPPETDESRRRREQSDRASAEIGNRLLRGWAMLGDECPNESCFGIPLVRPPNKPNGEKDLRKECVVCGNIYMPQSAQLPAMTQPEPSPEPNRPANEIPATSHQEGRNLGVQQPIVQAQPSFTKPNVITPVLPLTASGSANRDAARLVEASSALTALSTTNRALQNVLHSLSARMNAFASSTSMDVTAVGSTADSISKVVQALGQVKALEWTEAQARGVELPL